MDLLSVRGLNVHFGHPGERVQVLYDVDLTIGRGEIVGLVGESGSGKTVTSLALMGLLDERVAHVEGHAVLDGAPLWDQRHPIRRRPGVPMAMVFQEPMTALDPVFTVGSQLVETLRARQALTKRRARSEAVDLLAAVGLSDPKARLDAYPHQLSGGMRQRVMIAIALACDPKLLVADEPTTAVDVTIQAQLLELIKNLARDRGMSVLFVTHDLGVVAETCDRMVTMYAGRVVERGRVADVLTAPGHPYTAGLLAALPALHDRGERLTTIPGRVPPAGQLITGCAFAPRCRHRVDACEDPQELVDLPGDRASRCLQAQVLVPQGAM